MRGTSYRAIFSGAVALMAVACGDLGANPGQNGLNSSYAGSAGTGAGGSGPASCPSSVTPGGVRAILQKNCTGCHGTQLLAGAPMPLASFGDLHQPAKSNPSKKVYELVLARMRDAQKPMPPQGQLTAAEISTIDTWVAAGAPECGFATGAGGSGTGGSGTGGSGTGGSGTGGSGTNGASGMGGSSGTAGTGGSAGVECFELRAHNGQTPGDTTPFQVGLGPWPQSPGQFYENFIFKAPWNKKVTALKLEPIIDNGPVLHHWLLFEIRTGKEAFVDGSHTTILGTHPGSELVAIWAPGGDTIDMPPGVALAMPEPGGMFELEIHYFNPGGAMKLDRSGVRLCVTSEPVQNVATITWLGTENINVPGRSPGTAIGTCRPLNSGGGDIHILTSIPHMHTTGTHLKTVINRAGGGNEILVDKPFKFDEQRSYATPAVVRPGDTLTTTCTYNNTTAQNIGFGTVSELEMCYNFVFAYPARALHNPGLSWEGSQNTCLHE